MRNPVKIVQIGPGAGTRMGTLVKAEYRDLSKDKFRNGNNFLISWENISAGTFFYRIN
jgi:myo-inositol-hexaphosphate 3-phosphohydrolase